MSTNSNRCFAELSRDLGIHSVDSSCIFRGDVFVPMRKAEKDEMEWLHGIGEQLGYFGATLLLEICSQYEDRAVLIRQPQCADGWTWKRDCGTGVFPLNIGLLLRFIDLGEIA